MATKKASPKKSATTLMQKFGETASHLKEEIVAGKDHLAEVAGDAIESIKTSIQNITHKKKVAKKAVKPVAKKSVAKKAAKKTILKVAVKKSASPKKAIKKVARKK